MVGGATKTVHCLGYDLLLAFGLTYFSELFLAVIGLYTKSQVLVVSKALNIDLNSEIEVYTRGDDKNTLG